MIKDFRTIQPDLVSRMENGDTITIYIIRRNTSRHLDKVFRDSKVMMKEYGIPNNTLVAFGDTSEAPPTGAMSYISDAKTVIENGKQVTSYTCFAGVDWKKTPVHQNVNSVFECIMDRLVKPKYILILKLNVVDVMNFNTKQKEL